MYIRGEERGATPEVCSIEWYVCVERRGYQQVVRRCVSADACETIGEGKQQNTPREPPAREEACRVGDHFAALP